MRSDNGISLSSRLPFIFILASALIYLFITSRVPLLSFEKGELVISDFAYYLTVTHAFFSGEVTNPYLVSSQQQTLSNLLHTEFLKAMPVALMPTSFYIFYPFSLLFPNQLALASALWSGISVALLMKVLLCYSSRLIRSPLPLALVFTIICSFVSLTGVLLGQTSFVAAGGLGALILSTTGASLLGTVLLLIALSMKPTYLIFGTLFLLLNRNYRALMWGGAIILGILLIFSAQNSGFQWIRDYLETVQAFQSPMRPAAYDSAFSAKSMNIFASWAGEMLPAKVVSSISSVISFFAIASPFILLALSSKFRSLDSRTRALLGLNLSLTGYLLFAPYLGGYEDLLILIPILISIELRERWPRLNLSTFGIVLALFIAGNFLVCAPMLGQSTVWLAKLVLLSWLLAGNLRSNFSLK